MWKIGCGIVLALIVLGVVISLIRGNQQPVVNTAPPPPPGASKPLATPAAKPVEVKLNLPEKLESGVEIRMFPAGQDPEAGGSPSKILYADGLAGRRPETMGQIESVSGYIKIDAAGKYNFTLHLGELCAGKLLVNSYPVVEGKLESAGDKEGRDYSAQSLQLDAGYHKVELIVKAGVYAGGEKFWWDTIEKGMEHTYVSMAAAGQPLTQVAGGKVFRAAK